MITAGMPPLVHLEGAPRLRGHTHGEALRPLIARGVQCWKEAIHDSTGLDPDTYLDRFVATTDFRPAIARCAPLLDEVRGIGEGANIPFRDIYAYQLMDEEWLFRVAPTHGKGSREPDFVGSVRTHMVQWRRRSVPVGRRACSQAATGWVAAAAA